MAFSTTTVAVQKFAPGIDRSPLYDDLASALAAQTSSLTSLGGKDVLARAVVNFLDLYRENQDLSAAALLSVHASATSSLVTIQVQIIPAV